MKGTVRRVCRNVKRWQNVDMALRWTAAGMMEAAKGFRRLKAHKQLPITQSCAGCASGQSTRPNRNLRQQTGKPHSIINRQRSSRQFQQRRGTSPCFGLHRSFWRPTPCLPSRRCVWWSGRCGRGGCGVWSVPSALLLPSALRLLPLSALLLRSGRLRHLQPNRWQHRSNNKAPANASGFFRCVTRCPLVMLWTAPPASPILKPSNQAATSLLGSGWCPSNIRAGDANGSAGPRIIENTNHGTHFSTARPLITGKPSE